MALFQQLRRTTPPVLPFVGYDLFEALRRQSLRDAVEVRATV
jgi:hypothetical protein